MCRLQKCVSIAGKIAEEQESKEIRNASFLMKNEGWREKKKRKGEIILTLPTNRAEPALRAPLAPSLLRHIGQRRRRRYDGIRRIPTFLPTLPILLDELNESRDVYAFIRRIRAAFQELAVQGR